MPNHGRRAATRRAVARRTAGGRGAGPRIALVLYARVPRLGRVKTRLAPPLSRAGALDLHIALLADAAATLRLAARRTGAVPWLALSSPWEPPAAGPLAFLRRALRGLRRAPQRPGGDLGARMRRTVRGLLGRGFAGVVIVGSDCPALPVALLTGACRALRRGADLVLGPADDGGYCLIGLAADRPALFRGVPWGSARVLRATLARARRLGLRVALLDRWFDVDRPRDLARLRRLAPDVLRRRAPRTAALLARPGDRAHPARARRTARP